MITPDEEWSLVRLPNGKEGWMLSRFLTYDKPCCLELEILRQKNKALISQYDILLKENMICKKQNKGFSVDLSETKDKFAKVSESYNTLKNESADFFKLKSEYKKVTEQLAEQTERAEKNEARLSKLSLHSNIVWFLSGSGVLLVGVLIGLSARRQRRKTSLL